MRKVPRDWSGLVQPFPDFGDTAEMLPVRTGTGWTGGNIRANLACPIPAA